MCELEQKPSSSRLRLLSLQAPLANFVSFAVQLLDFETSLFSNDYSMALLSLSSSSSYGKIK
jgi:hypothetical protein